MTIETKYNIGDEVWVIMNNRVECVKIQSVKLEVYTDYKVYKVEVYPVYYDFCGGRYYETQLFPTKEELIKSL